MIRTFNRRQRLKAVVSLVSGILAYGIAWLFFRYVTGQAFRMSGVAPAPWLEPAITAAILLVITVSGWGQHHAAREPDMSDAVWWKGGVETMGAAGVQYRVNQLSSSAWFLASLSPPARWGY